MADAVANAIKAIAGGKSLSEHEATDAFDAVMQGDASAVQIAAMLVGLRARGETAEEVAGAVRALRRAMIQVDAPDPDSLVDTCGTGGGAVNTFNISTAAAFVVAGSGVRVAKHGNRSFTSRSGSADVLEALGIAVDTPTARLRGVLDEAGMVFMFAPAMHPAMRHAIPVRRELGVPTLLNMIGPLANPAGVRRQVVGVADRSRLLLLANALNRLGAVHALVVHGEPGLDEFSPMGVSSVAEVRNGAVTEWSIDPLAYGMSLTTAAEIAGGSPEENAQIIERVVRGTAPDGVANAVLLNAAAALYVSGRSRDFAAGLDVARHAIQNGDASAALARLRKAAPRR